MTGRKINFCMDRWVSNQPPLRNTIGGPLNEGDKDIKLLTYGKTMSETSRDSLEMVVSPVLVSISSSIIEK